MNKEIQSYNLKFGASEREICDELMEIIDENLGFSESNIWHSHPVWFIEGNPIVGYSKLKAGIKLMFWSGDSFGDDRLEAGSGKFKDASITFSDKSEIDKEEIVGWLKKSEEIQWDYKNIVKRKGKLVRLK